MLISINALTRRISCSAFILVFLQACSGITVSQDYEKEYNFAGLKTFAWKPNEQKAYGVKDNDLLDKRIRTAIENAMRAKSYQPVETFTPDFFISYHYNVEQKITSSGLSTGSDVRAYEQGTLLIDVTIPLGDKLVWRGTSTQSVSEHTSPEKSTANINETVEKILAQFPPQ
jgi:hypothetical protein